MENRRKITQALVALLYNFNLKGLLDGKLYRGRTKSLCVPGLNCYSCPAAVSSCPLGALQSTLATIRRGVHMAVIGFLLAFSALFGRIVCGWLCPFGLVQELLFKIPGPKKKIAGKRLRWIKYAVLILFVIAIPVYTAITKLVGYPAFCKYICPQGTIGGILMVAADDSLTELIGATFIWKIAVLVIVVLAAVFTFRPFCRFICPLGALYGLFNSIALIRMSVSEVRCTSCGACHDVCPVNLEPEKEINSCECIRCGQCMKACSANAISFIPFGCGLNKKKTC